MHPLVHKIAERGVDLALPVDPIETLKGGAFDRQCEMALAARIVAGVPDMLVTLVLQLQSRGRQRGGQPLDHLACNGSGGGGGHHSYIAAFEESDTSGNAAEQMARAS